MDKRENSFVDVDGKEWVLNININTIKRVKELCNVDLMQVTEGDNNVLNELHNDIETLVNVIYVILKPQCDNANITDEQFGELLATGDIIENAVNALVEGLLLFFPPHKRRILKAVIEKMQQMEELAGERVEKEINSLDIEKVMDEAIRQAKSGNSLDIPIQS